MSSVDDIRAIVDPPLDLPEALQVLYRLAAEPISIAAEFCAMPERFELDPGSFRQWDRMLCEAYDRLAGFTLSYEARLLAEAPDVFAVLEEVREEAGQIRTRLSAVAKHVPEVYTTPPIVDPRLDLPNGLKEVNRRADCEDAAEQAALDNMRRTQLHLAHSFFGEVAVSAEPLRRLRLVLSVWAKKWAMQTADYVLTVEQPPPDGALPTPEMPADEAGTADAAPPIYFLGNGAYRVGQGEPITVSDREDCILQAFIGSPALDMSGIAKLSGLKAEAIPAVVSRLRQKYNGTFGDAIKTPGGKAKGGYRATVIDQKRKKSNDLR